MRIGLEGRTARVCGERHAVAEAVGAALSANGATVTWAEPGAGAARADLLILSHRLDLAGEYAPAGLIELASASAGLMAEHGSGTIVHLISAAGLVPMRRHPEASVAMASVVASVRALAMRAAPAIRVNAVAAGWIESAEPVGDPAMLSHAPLGRGGSVADIVHAALFLCDPMNSYTTGQVLAVDGGWTTGYARNF